MATNLDLQPLADAVAEALLPKLREELRALLEGFSPPEQRLSTDDLASVLKTSPATIRDWGVEGCPHVRVGKGAHRWVLSEVEAWLGTRSVGLPMGDPAAGSIRRKNPFK